MANQSSSSSSSSSYPILCASFNQDASHFVIGTREGFKVFDSNTGRLCYERAIGAFIVVEMLFTSSLLAIVGAGEQPSLSPRRLCLFNITTGTALRELNFLTSILAVRMNKERLIVILQDKTYVYDINKVKILDAIDTVPNLKGLCGFSPSLDGCFLALPASITKGSVLLYNVMELQSHCEIDAHRAPLAAIVLCSNGMHIATASEQGTIIRVHLVSDATKSYSFRRGRYPSTIFSLSFAPSMQIPDILVATSSSGSLHVFSLGFALNQRSRKSSTILGSIIPDSITDVLDPAHRHVLHSAVTAGVKSNAVIRKVDKVADASTPGIASCKATISIITYNGYFQEYSFRLNYQNEPLWTLEHEFNLLSPVSDNASS
ncbi:autophagy-related protein 18b isoform X1 [Juglans microcarpa x Juglans regia]|uniref:autophagy-related protein 18b isoform X1 n=1 Tax=Juglans microcarpa x Juglans regia TaxID=2249226 RepID=UPI001B7F202E|nr:autophagy-related protein 18b isoform X1 [Juglans microcarpa x Juglans regia]